MIVDGVFAGGGMKAIALVGALQTMEEKHYSFERVAGTSAGALIAAMVASGYKSSEMTQILKTTSFEQLMTGGKRNISLPFMKWLRLYWKLGMYKGDVMEEWIRRLLRNKGVHTFADLPEGSLKVIASDLSEGEILVLPDDLKRRYNILPEKFSVARAVYMSSSLPFFFRPANLYNRLGEKSVIVDGGVLSNFPMWLFDRGDNNARRPVIGFQLRTKPENQPARKIKNAVDLYQSLFFTMKSAHDARYITDNEAAKIVFIPVDQISTTQFDIDEASKDALLRLGQERTAKFLKTWTY